MWGSGGSCFGVLLHLPSQSPPLVQPDSSTCLSLSLCSLIASIQDPWLCPPSSLHLLRSTSSDHLSIPVPGAGLAQSCCQPRGLPLPPLSLTSGMLALNNRVLTPVQGKVAQEFHMETRNGRSWGTACLGTAGVMLGWGVGPSPRASNVLPEPLHPGVSSQARG